MKDNYLEILKGTNVLGCWSSTFFKNWELDV